MTRNGGTAPGKSRWCRLAAGCGALAMAGMALAGCGGGGGSAGDIETWLIEVGNDFPDSAACVADEMKDYSVSDFEGSFRGDSNPVFDSELDAAYLMCEAKLGITSDE